jgi:hypothetical protein
MSTNRSAEKLGIRRRCGQTENYSNVGKIQFTVGVYAPGGQLFFTWATLKQPWAWKPTYGPAVAHRR